MTNRILCLAVPLALLVVQGAMAASAPSTCPLPEQGETALDCPWAGVARDLQAGAIRTEELGPILKKEVPNLYDQIHGEKSSKSWHPLWGFSINFDELARGIIVDPAILSLLYSTSSIPAPQLGAGAPDNIQHAGLEHTYGYLFSVLKTSFGYKRARWVAGEIDRGFGFANDPISPHPKRGSLFRNVTYFIGRIAFRHDPKMLVVLEGRRGSVEPELTKVKFDKLKITRVEETLALENGRTVVLRSDLVTFPIAPATPEAGAPAPNDTLLVYSYVDAGQPKLVSAFPVTASFGAGIMKPESLGPDQPIITRYNAYIPGVTGKSDLKGTRTVTEHPDSQ